MKTWVKILLIIFAVILIGLVAAGLYIYSQVSSVIKLQDLQNDEQFKADLQDLIKGNCSKYADVEQKLNELEKGLTTIDKGCSNSLIRAQIEERFSQSGISICGQLTNATSEVNKKLEEIKQNCAGIA